MDDNMKCKHGKRGDRRDVGNCNGLDKLSSRKFTAPYYKYTETGEREGTFSSDVNSGFKIGSDEVEIQASVTLDYMVPEHRRSLFLQDRLLGATYQSRMYQEMCCWPDQPGIMSGLKA